MGNKTSSESTVDDEIRMVLIGKSGCGKSATGNSILQKIAFESKPSSSSVTKTCRRGENVYNTGTKKYNLVVVDTPGLYDTEMSNEATSKEITKCVGISSPGPHAMLFVVSLQGRFTEEEEKTAQHFIDLFGEDLKQFMIIVFSHGDNVPKNETIEERVKSAPTSLKELIKSCENRYVVFNNKVTSKDKMKNQLSKLFEIISVMVSGRIENFYSDEMYKNTERALQARMEELQRELSMKNKMAEIVDLRKSVRNEVEQESDVLTKIGKGIYDTATGLISHTVESTGIPRLVTGIASWMGY